MMQPSEAVGFSISLSLVWISAIGLVMLGLGNFGILDNNEGLYAEIPREMLVASDWRHWIIPHLNTLPYMEKPPLLYWLTALSFALFGEAEWAARAVPALSALACVAMLLRFGVAVGRPQAGRMAALMFISGVGVGVMAHLLMFDMLLTAFLTAALMCAYLYSIDRRSRFVRSAYGFLALALLAKGFVAIILFGLVVGGFLVVSQRSITALRKDIESWCEPWGLAIFFVIAVPWHLAASMVEPAFPWFYFINEHVLRFLGLREPHDYYAGPWWYYLPRMMIYLFPWSFLLPCLAFVKRQERNLGCAQLKRFLGIAWLAPLLFFSISSAKANYYLIAVMPFAALHFAVELDDRIPMRKWVRALPSVLIGTLALVFGSVLAMRADTTIPTIVLWGNSPRQAGAWFCAGMAILAFGSAILIWRQAKISLATYLFLSFYVAIALSLILPRIEPYISTRPLAAYLQGELNGRKVYLYRNFEERSSLPFYLKRPVPVIDSHSNDLFWGNKLKPNDLMISQDQFGRLAKSESVAVVVVGSRREEFKTEPFINHFRGEKKIGETSVFFN